jgi:hypothetical protein
MRRLLIFALLHFVTFSLSLPVLAQNPLFAPAVSYGAGSHPTSVYAADLDGDGDNDLAITNETSNNVAILKNNGSGIFQTAIFYGVLGFPYSVVAADLDGDADNDLAVTNHITPGFISILLNNGDGTFQPAVNYAVGSNAHSIYAADLDGDGDNDLAVANCVSNNISILKNNGNATFQTATNYSVGSGPYDVVAIDLDGDGDADLATVNGISNNVSILFNNGIGLFQAPLSYMVNNYPTSVYAADYDGDGAIDLAVTNGNSDDVSILKNIGDGTFQPAINYGAGDSPFSVVAADFDGDGYQDLATANGFSNTISILKNNSGETFQPALEFDAGTYPYSIYAVDIDNDGDKDVATANYNSNNVSILQNLTINQGILNKPGLTSITIYESTDGVVPYTFNKTDARLVNDVNQDYPSFQYDFKGDPFKEFYDVFVSDESGNLNLAGEYITIECYYNSYVQGTSVGNNIEAISLNFQDGHTEWGTTISSFVLGNGIDPTIPNGRVTNALGPLDGQCTYMGCQYSRFTVIFTPIALPYEETFDDGNAHNWFCSTGFSVQSGSLCSEIHSSYQASLAWLPGSSAWTDYQFDVDLNLSQGQNRNVYFRMTDINHYYDIGFPTYGIVKLWRVGDGALLQQISHQVPNPTRMHVKVIGPRILAWFDDDASPIIDYTDNDPTHYLTGGIGLVGWTGGDLTDILCFDNIIVNELPVGSITGIVTETDDTTPIPGALVKALQNGQEIARFTTGDDGLYIFANFPPGAYDLAVSKFGYALQTRGNIEVIAGQPTTENFQLEHSLYASVRGTVKKCSDNSDLQGVSIDFYQDDIPRYLAVTQEDGSYNLSGVFAGIYEVHHSKEGYQTQIIERSILPDENPLNSVSLIPNGFVSSLPLKLAMDAYHNTYKAYLTHMSDRIVDLENEIFTELNLPEYSYAKTISKDFWDRFRLPVSDITLSLSQVIQRLTNNNQYLSSSDNEGLQLSSLSIAKDMAFIALENYNSSAFAQIHDYLQNSILPVPVQDLRDKNMVILNSDPPIPGQHVYSILSILTQVDNWDLSGEIPDCLPADFPANDIIDNLNQRIGLLKKVTYSELSNFPDYNYEDSWTVGGYSGLDKEAMCSFGLINYKIREVRNQLVDLEFKNTFSRGVRSGCQRFGAGSTSFKAINLLWPKNIINKNLPYLGKYLFWGGLTCSGGSFISGFVTTGSQASLAEKLSDFNLFWPDYYGRSFQFYKKVNKTISDAANNLENLFMSQRYSVPTMNLPSDACFAIGEITRTMDGTVTIQNLDLAKPGKIIVVGSVCGPIGGSDGIIYQFRSDITEISPGGSSTVPFSFDIPTPTYFKLYDNCWVSVDILTTSKTIHLNNKQIMVGIAPDCEGQAPYRTMQSVTSENIGSGQWISHNYSSSVSSKSCTFTMGFGGSDVDLHLYDQAGNHVGRNYETGELEMHIQGAQFWGDSSTIEAITIPTSPGAIYQVKAYGANLADSEIVTIDAIEELSVPPALQVYPPEAYLDLFRGDTLDYSGRLFDRSGQNTIVLDSSRVSEFTDSTGDTLPLGSIRILYPNLITADSISNYTMVFGAPATQQVGLYSGSITFISGPDSLVVPTRIKIDEKASSVLYGRVTNIAGHPIGGVNITVQGTSKMAATDNLGNYTIDSLVFGTYDISFTRSGLRDTMISYITLDFGDTVNLDMVMGSTCQYEPGDANGVGGFTGLDVTYSVRYFKGGPHPPYSCDCPPHGTWYVSGDVNGSCTFSGLDITYMVRYFKGGPHPIPCADCPPSGLLAPPIPGSEPIKAPVLKPRGQTGTSD